MMPNLLILGGTTEASRLAEKLASLRIPATLSYAGRVASPKPQPLPVRTGGFGGVEGLVSYLKDNGITHLVDATHPFAAQMSHNAARAARRAGVPLVALCRRPWTPGPGDDWRAVPDMAGAVAALAGPPRRVMLALGRLHLAEFAAQPQHHYLLRLVDRPGAPPPLPDHDIVIARGPFDIEGDMALLRERGIDTVVSKNAGGAGAEAKLHAARALGLPVIMIDRPAMPERREVATVAGVIDWLSHAGTDRGV